MTSVLSAADCFHTGMVVTDLDAAMAQLTEIGGYRWTSPMSHPVPVLLGSKQDTVEFRMTYSVQAPHLELVQQIPGTLWTPAPGNAPHHLGYFVDDVAAASEKLTATGYAFEAGDVDPDTGVGPTRFAFHNNPLGIRIEIVARQMFGDWPAFLQAMAQ